MAPSTRSNCCLNLAWRYIALVLIIGSLISATAALTCGDYVANDAIFVCLINSGWWAISIFWNLFVIIWESVRKTPMAPGAVVGMDLIITLYGLGGAITWGIWMANDVNFQYYWAMNFTNVYGPSEADKNRGIACFSIFSAFAILATVIHFTLFVIGCIHEDRRLKKNAALLATLVAAYNSPPPAPQHNASAPAGSYYAPSEMPVPQDSKSAKSAVGVENQRAEREFA